MHKYLPQANSWAPVAVGTRRRPLKNLDSLQISLRRRSPSAQADEREIAAHAGFHSANAAMTQTEDHMAEATIGALANLATSTAAYRGVVAALTQANARLVKQLEESSSELRELKALLHKERCEKRWQRTINATATNYW
jgi:hypothetical protein